MAKKKARRSVGAKTINKAAKIAAAEAITEFETETDDLSLDTDEVEEHEVIEQPDSLDVFEEGHRRAVSLNDTARFSIKRNSELIATKDYPYSWDRVRQDYGPGYYQIIAKRRSNGHLLKQQSETLGDPNEGREEQEVEIPSQSENLSVLALMTQQQERADARAREATQKTENGLATVMQTVMQMQQQSNQQMMTMFMEQQKQTQTLMMTMFQSQNKPQPESALMPILTALITAKPKDEGMKWTEVLKLVQDAEKRAEDRTARQYEMIDKKADQLAEIKAEAMSSGDSGEKPTMFQSLVPILSQVLAGQQAQGQGQPSPEQIAHQRMLEERQRLNAGASLNEGFTETRPAIPAARPEQRRTMPNPQARPRPVQAVPNVSQPGAGATVAGPTQVQNQVPSAGPAKGVQLDDRTKKNIFDFAAPDIGNALLQGLGPDITAETVLKKLESEGIARQTVATAFTVEDFYGYAALYQVPKEANPWLKDFHEAIQKLASAESVRSAGTVASVVESAPASVVDAKPASNGAKPAKPVASSRSGAAPRGAGAKPQPAPKNI